MRVLLYVVSVLGLLVGLAIWAAAKSAIHEILGTLLIGFSFLMVGLAAILGELQDLNKSVRPRDDTAPKVARVR